MAFIPISQVKPGMILSADAADVNGRLLLAKGQTIDANHLMVFKMWGVSDVAVEQADTDMPDADKPLDPAIMRRVAEQLRPAFANNDLSHPAVAEIFRQAVLHRARLAPPARVGAVTEFSRPPSPPSSDGAARRRNLQSRDIQLPEIPSMIFKINDIIADPFSSADDIAQVISNSPGLSALLLRIVNSAFYGFPSRIDSITRAVTIIGSREVSALAVGVITMEVFKDIPKNVFDMRAFIHHSLACGVLARILAASGNIRNTEQMFVSGLLHDIGRMVIFHYFPDQAPAMLAMTGTGSLYEQEKQVLGFRHTEIAADLFEKWKFPVTLSQNIVFHHRPMAAQDPVKAAVVHLADILAHGLGEGKSGEWRIPTLDATAWEKLRLSPHILSGVIPQALHHLGFLMTVFPA
ncbi:putative Metal dependent phosphohydrolase [Desulfosarcina cetonica]|uniref:HDOD domain-containing protein n=1 Tax=Desulfosarcina cetonica TaxID=90730 RepID=UPI0006D0080F|nr:HDOD domain-containing protein [Desulfosarcina cetonica]VTR68158.1 putative Metal dependent phosphohydrolase [Desulfosarcina cetonica]